MKKLEKALNSALPNGYTDFDSFADVVLAAGDFEPRGEEWTISPYHTGQRSDPNDWNSSMLIGVSIEVPELNVVVTYDGYTWSVS